MPESDHSKVIKDGYIPTSSVPTGPGIPKRWGTSPCLHSDSIPAAERRRTKKLCVWG